MYNIVLVKIVDCAEDLLDGLGSVLFSEFALVANTVEQLSSSCQLGDNVEFVLVGVSFLRYVAVRADMSLRVTRTSRQT